VTWRSKRQPLEDEDQVIWLVSDRDIWSGYLAGMWPGYLAGISGWYLPGYLARIWLGFLARISGRDIWPGHDIYAATTIPDKCSSYISLHIALDACLSKNCCLPGIEYVNPGASRFDQNSSSF
jgi:hypothetical protein